MEADARTAPGRLQRGRYTFPLALCAAVALVLLGEWGYWRTGRALASYEAHASQKDIEQARLALQHDLWLSRIGSASLGFMLCVALVMGHRASVARRTREGEHRQVAAERSRLEQLVRQRTEELTELTRHLEWAAEEARARLAGTLHDDMGALLTAAKLDAARLRIRMGDTRSEDPEGAGERLVHLVQTLDEVIALKRRVIEDLRPSALQHLGLVPALEGLLGDFTQRTGLPVHTALTPVPLADEVALTGYRLVQEALENVAQHAHAHSVTVRLRPVDSATAQLEVSDDGQGFDPAQRGAVSHGLVGLRYRVQAVHGEWRLATAPGAGTRVAARLPLSRAAASTASACQAPPTQPSAPR